MTGDAADSATDYQTWRGIDYQPAVRKFLPEKLLPYLSVGARVLDVGCNTGSVVRFLAANGMRCEGIDINQQAVQSALSSSAAQAGCFPRFHQGDFLDFSFGAEFDAVVMIRFITCVPEAGAWNACLAKASDILIPGGLMYIHDFLMAPSSSVYAARYEDGISRGWRVGNFPVNRSDGSLSFVAHHHTPEDIKQIESRFSRQFFHEHESLSMNGNHCLMFEFIGRKIDQPATSTPS